MRSVSHQPKNDVENGVVKQHWNIRLVYINIPVDFFKGFGISDLTHVILPKPDPGKFKCYVLRNILEQTQGSHSTWKTWKNENTPGKPGNIMEF